MFRTQYTDDLMRRRVITPDEFYKACYDGNFALVQQYIEDHLDTPEAVNIVRARHETPLMMAIIRGQQAIALALLAVDGIDINARSDEGRTALMFAFGCRYRDIIDVLKALLAFPQLDVNAQLSPLSLRLD